MIEPTILASALSEEVRKAREAQQAWALMPVRGRLDFVKRFRYLLVSRCETLVKAAFEDMKKPRAEVLAGDLLPLADACRFLETEAIRLLRPRSISQRVRPMWMWGQKDTVYRRPRGIVGIIGTWNYPFFLNGVQLVQALTAGNAVIWKPSEVTPRSARVLFDLILESGYPSSLIQLLDCSREMGAQLIEADIQHLVFTGSAQTGRRIAARLGERLINSTMELSGCDALFVLDDADVALAAQAVLFGVLLNAGQTCLAVRRVFVQKDIYQQFCDFLSQHSGCFGPVLLAIPGQVEQANRLIQAGIEAGARLLTGFNQPRDLHPNQFQPAILIDARPEMDICREASFAPIVSVLPVNDEADALAQNARCSFGLGASIFSSNISRAERMAENIPTGAVTINDVIVPTAHPGTPFGGRGDSGWGVTQGDEGLLEMTVQQVVSSRKDRFRPHYDLIDPKQAPKQEEMALGLLQANHGKTLANRIAGWRRLIRSFWQSNQRNKKQ